MCLGRDPSLPSNDEELHNVPEEGSVSEQQLPAELTSEPSPDNSENSEKLAKNDETFNSFQYWKSPLPEIDIDSELKEWSGANGSRGDVSAASGLPEVRVTNAESTEEVFYLSIMETMSDFEKELILNSSETRAENSMQNHERILTQVSGS